MHDELSSGKEIVDLSPPQALDRASSFLVGQGYVIVHRTVTTLMVERRESPRPNGQGEILKVVVMAVPQRQGGVKIKVRGDSEGLQGRQGLWRLWIKNLPRRRH